MGCFNSMRKGKSKDSRLFFFIVCVIIVSGNIKKSAYYFNNSREAAIKILIAFRIDF